MKLKYKLILKHLLNHGLLFKSLSLPYAHSKCPNASQPTSFNSLVHATIFGNKSEMAYFYIEFTVAWSGVNVIFHNRMSNHNLTC